MRARQRIAAYALIADDTGRVLLTRGPGGRRRARWLLPGGGVEHGEHPEQTVIREAREETGLRINVGPLRDVASDVATVGRRRRSLHNVRLVYQADVASSDAPSAGGHERDDVRWCARPDWEMLPLAPFTARVLGCSAGDAVDLGHPRRS